MKISKEYFFVVTAGITSGLIIFIGQILANYGFSTFETAILPYAPAILFLLPIIIWRGQRRSKKNIGPLLLRALIEALMVLSQFGGIVFGVPVAIIVLLIYTQPFWTMILGSLLLRERIKWFHIVSSILVLLGVFFLVYPFAGGLELSVTGVIIGLSSGLFLSLRIIVGGRVSRKDINPYLAKFSETLFGIAILSALYPLAKMFIHNSSVVSFQFNWPIHVWLYCIGFALFTQVIGHVLYLKGIKKVPAISVGIIFLLEPLVATILATIFLHQVLTIYMVIGGILILLGNVFVMIYGQKNTLPRDT